MTAKKNKEREVLETKSVDLLVKLEEKEINERARKLASKQGELERHNEEGRRIQGEHAQRRKRIEGEITSLGNAVREGTELRPVVVDVVADFKRAVVLEVRQDTEEVISERAMRPDERQTTMPAAAVRNEAPKTIAQKLFDEGVRPEDVGIEGKVEEAAKAGGAEIVAVLDALVEIAEFEGDGKKAKKAAAKE